MTAAGIWSVMKWPHRAHLHAREGTRGAIPGKRGLQRAGIAEHREVLLAGRLRHVALPELPSQPAPSIFEKPGRGARIEKGLVMARAVLLVVRVLAEGAPERSGMGT